MKYFATRISENMHKTPEGYLLVLNVPIGRTGTMEYGRGETPIEVGKDGIARVSRSSEDLFRPETIASFEGKPLTIKHPEDFVNPSNWKLLSKGSMQNVRRGKGDLSEDLVCDILITDEEAISLVDEGVRELSCGYEADYEQTDEGRGIQKNIIGNHLALVEDGRAGNAYRINDSKGVFKMDKSMADKFKSFFIKTIDEATEKVDEKKSTDSNAMDEMKAMFKDVCDQMIATMKKGNDEAPPAPKKVDEKPVEDEDVVEEVATESSPEDRLKALELAVKQILEKLSEKTAEEVDDEEAEVEVDDEESDMVTDEDDLDEETSDEEKPKLTGDTASRAEILAPGLNKQTKDVKSAALKAAYKTADGKKIIDALSGGKPNFADKKQVDNLFVSASEVLKVSRTQDLSKTKVNARTNDFQSHIFDNSAMTPEKMNEINAKKYNIK